MATSLKSKMLNRISLILEDLDFEMVRVNPDQLRVTFHTKKHLISGRIDLFPNSLKVEQRLFFMDADSSKVSIEQQTTFNSLGDFEASWISHS